MAPRISTRLPMYFDRSFFPPSSTTVEPPAKMVSGLRLAFVTTSSGWPDGDAGCGSSWTHPVTTTVLGFFDCPAAVAARQRHIAATTTIPVGLICTSEQPRRSECAIGQPPNSRGRIQYPTPAACCCRVDSALEARLQALLARSREIIAPETRDAWRRRAAWPAGLRRYAASC